MIVTTLGYLEHDNCYLMLHRVKKKNDINHEKWIGIGGKMEEGETVLECMKRECREETGLEWHDPTLRALITFNFRPSVQDPLFSELMCLYSGSQFSGTLRECAEGDLEWVPVDQISKLPLWKGDLIFLDLLRSNHPLFYLELNYIGDTLTSALLDGAPIDLTTI